MKKILFAAVAALAITSCSQNEEFENAGRKAEIGFSTIVSKATRATEATNTTLQGSGFTVYAYNTGTNSVSAGNATLATVIMPGAKATYTDKWGLDGTYYWPLNDNVQFFAYATDDSVANYTADASKMYPTLKYTVAKSAADQKDFVVAQVTDQKKTTGDITLTFKHALTQINFSIKGEDANTYKVSSLSIVGVAESGVYSYEPTVGWTPTANETTGTYTYPIAGNASVTGTTAVDLMQANGALMLIPQSMTAAAKIKISYSVHDGDDALLATNNDVDISLENAEAWVAGQKVRYTLKLANNAAKMSFDTTVDPWNGEKTPSQDTPVTPKTN